MNIFARETPRPHLRVANDITEVDQSPMMYPYSDLQVMAEFRSKLEHFSDDERVRILKYIVEIYNLPRPE